MSNPNFGLVYKTELTSNDASAQEQQGVLRYELDDTNGLKIYKYVQARADTTVAAGTALMYTISVTSLDDVTLDVTDGGQNFPAGVGLGAITAEYFGWIQIYGYHSAVLTDAGDDISAGDTIIIDTGDGVVDSVAAGTASTYRPMGIAQADDVNAADTVAVFLNCPH